MMKHWAQWASIGVVLGILASACASPVQAVTAPAGRGKVTFTAYYEPGSAWSTNTAAQRAVRGLLDQYEAILVSGGAWASLPGP